MDFSSWRHDFELYCNLRKRPVSEFSYIDDYVKHCMTEVSLKARLARKLLNWHVLRLTRHRFIEEALEAGLIWRSDASELQYLKEKVNEDGI